MSGEFEGVRDPAQMRWLILEKLMDSGVPHSQWAEMTEKLYATAVGEEYHVEETLGRVRRAIYDSIGGARPETVDGIVNNMLNAGILFRERR